MEIQDGMFHASPVKASKRRLTHIISAAHLKFLHRKRQIPARNFKWKAALKTPSLLELL
jgi:hypothetical protein